MQSHNQKISATEQDQFSSFASPVQLISLANLQRRNNIYIPSQCNCCSWLKLDASLIPADNADVATNPRLLANCNTVQHCVTVTHIHRKPSKWNVEEFMEKHQFSSEKWQLHVKQLVSWQHFLPSVCACHFFVCWVVCLIVCLSGTFKFTVGLWPKEPVEIHLDKSVTKIYKGKVPFIGSWISLIGKAVETQLQHISNFSFSQKTQERENLFSVAFSQKQILIEIT